MSSPLLGWRNLWRLAYTPCRQELSPRRTPNLREKSKNRLIKPACPDNDENRLHYDLWSLSERFTAVGATHAWDRLQGCCQGQFNVLGFSICHIDSTLSGIPVRTSGIVNINRIMIPLKRWPFFTKKIFMVILGSSDTMYLHTCAL